MWNFRNFRLSSQSSTEPVTVSEVSCHLRIQTTIEDALMLTYIKSARLRCEGLIKRALVPSSFIVTLDAFPSGEIILPRPPLSTQNSKIVISYIDSSGDTQTVSSTVYEVDHLAEPGEIRLAYDQNWPDVRNHPGVIRIAYASGYISTASSSTSLIPQDIKQWIMSRAGVMYMHREPLILDPRALAELPRDFVDGLLDEYRIID